MEKEIDVAYVLSLLDTVSDVNDRSVFSIKKHLVLINKIFKSKYLLTFRIENYY